MLLSLLCLPLSPFGSARQQNALHIWLESECVFYLDALLTGLKCLLLTQHNAA
jgi:hypothetical protein